MDINSRFGMDFVASVMVGAIVGWLFKIGSEMQENLERYDERLEDIINLFNYQGKTLRIMLDDRQHNEVIDELIDGAIKKNFNNIPFVDINSYFNYLSLALKQSDNFQGILDQPISWYQEKESDQSSSYLKSIKNKKDMFKRRVFFIRNDNVGRMEDDLKNHEIMKFYWENTGEDMESFWITEKDFNENFAGMETYIPKDCVLFDNKLYIEYFPDKQTLSFKILDSDYSNREEIIFDKLNKQITDQKSMPFRAISTKLPEKKTPKLSEGNVE